MKYRLEISRKALKQLRALPKEQRQNIGWRMEEMCEDLRGDVLKLQAKGNYYRLRVGNWAHLTFLQTRSCLSPESRRDESKIARQFTAGFKAKNLKVPKGRLNCWHVISHSFTDLCNKLRCALGNFRVLFVLAGDAIQVYAVKDRKEAYE